MTRRNAAAYFSGTAGAFFPVILLAAGFGFNARSCQKSPAAPTDSVSMTTMLQVPRLSLDKVHIIMARHEYLTWSRVQNRLAKARSLAARRSFEAQAALTRNGYALCYEEITPGARQAAGLPRPENVQVFVMP